MLYATVDITQQMLQMTPLPGASPNTAVTTWSQDVVASVLGRLGIYNISFTPTPPTDTTQLWWNQGNPPTGVPGSFFTYDAINQVWVPLTPTLFKQWFAAQLRQSIFDSTTGTTAPTIGTGPGQAKIGDFWWDPVGDRWYIATSVAPGVAYWIDVSGGQIDVNAIIAAAGPSLQTGNLITRGSDQKLFLSQAMLAPDIHVSGATINAANNQVTFTESGGGPSVVLDLSTLVSISDLQVASPTPPAAPFRGQEWNNTTNGQVSKWNGTSWVQLF